MKSKKVTVTEAELPIMKVIWEKGPVTSPELIDGIKGTANKNKSTLKTLLMRLVKKGAVKAEEINSRNYIYSALITQSEYINKSRKNFIERVYDGSAQKMLLNFVKEEKITKE